MLLMLSLSLWVFLFQCFFLFQSMGCVAQLRELLKEHSSKHGDDRTVAKVKQLLDDETKSTGLLINERFVNIPPQVAVPLLMNLR